MRRIIALFLLFVFTFNGVCCILRRNPETPIQLSEPMRKHIWIDNSFSEKEKDDIVRAFKTLECSTNYSLIQFEFTKNATISDTYYALTQPSIIIVKSLSTDPRIKKSDQRFYNEHKGKFTVGLYLNTEKIPTILIPIDRIDKKNKDIFYRITLHEAIHASLNILKHSDSKKSIMFYALDETSARDISLEDLEFICKSYRCKIDSFNICNGGE